MANYTRHYHMGNILAAAHVSMGHKPHTIKEIAEKRKRHYPIGSGEHDYFQGVVDRAALEAKKSAK